MNNIKKHYLFLDGLRAIAVLWVIFHHVFIFFDFKLILGVIPKGVSDFALSGAFGVDMFFVISGFLITGLLLDEFENGRINLRYFYLRRMLKIIPHFLLVVAVGIIFIHIIKPFHVNHVFFIESHNPSAHFWRYFVFLQNYSIDEAIPMLAHLWTIAVEEQFYLVYPFILLVICKLIKDSQQRRVLLVIFCLLIIIGENGLRFDIFKWGGVFNTFKTHFHLDGLVFGILIKLFEENINKIRGVTKSTFSILFFLVGMCLYCFLIQSRDGHSGWFYFAFAYIAPGLLLISGLMNCKLLTSITEFGALRWIGKSSYGIYLWHYLIIFIFASNPNRFGVLNTIIVYVLVSIILGYLGTITIERYFLSFRKYIHK